MKAVANGGLRCWSSSLRLPAFSKSALERPVGEVMSAPLITVSPKASVRDIAEAFQAHRIKRLPVLDDERLVGVVSRADLLCLVEGLPAAPPVRRGDGGGLLGFLESMIGGASLRGGLERHPERAQAPDTEKDAAPNDLSADAFRDAVRACKAESLDHGQDSKVEAQLERQRQIKALVEEHLSDAQWSQMLDKAKLAARSGEQELMMLRFPSDLCSDGGRKIDVAEEGWEGTLQSLRPQRSIAAGERSSSRGVSGLSRANRELRRWHHRRHGPVPDVEGRLSSRGTPVIGEPDKVHRSPTFRRKRPPLPSRELGKSWCRANANIAYGDAQARGQIGRWKSARESLAGDYSVELL